MDNDLASVATGVGDATCTAYIGNVRSFARQLTFLTINLTSYSKATAEVRHLHQGVSQMYDLFQRHGTFFWHRKIFDRH